MCVMLLLLRPRVCSTFLASRPFTLDTTSTIHTVVLPLLPINVRHYYRYYPLLLVWLFSAQ